MFPVSNILVHIHFQVKFDLFCSFIPCDLIPPSIWNEERDEPATTEISIHIYFVGRPTFPPQSPSFHFFFLLFPSELRVATMTSGVWLETLFKLISSKLTLFMLLSFWRCYFEQSFCLSNLDIIFVKKLCNFLYFFVNAMFMQDIKMSCLKTRLTWLGWLVQTQLG